MKTVNIPTNITIEALSLSRDAKTVIKEFGSTLDKINSYNFKDIDGGVSFEFNGSVLANFVEIVKKGSKYDMNFIRKRNGNVQNQRLVKSVGTNNLISTFEKYTKMHLGKDRV